MISIVLGKKLSEVKNDPMQTKTCKNKVPMQKKISKFVDSFSKCWKPKIFLRIL